MESLPSLLLANATETLPHAGWLIGLALVFGLFMAWSIGANDVANSMGTSVGSKALTLGKAIVLAGILEFAGALLVGRHVTDKIRHDIFAPGAFEGILNLYSYGMLASLLAAATWLLTATYFGLPVSTTHSIVGAVIGFGLVALKWNLIRWGAVVTIVASWVVSPALAAIASFLLFSLIQRQVLVQRDMVASAKRLAPILIFAVFWTVFLVTLYKGLKPVLKPLGLEDLTFVEAIPYAAFLAGIATLCCIPLIRRVRVDAATIQTGKHQNPVLHEELGRIQARLHKLTEIARGSIQNEFHTLQEQVSRLEGKLGEANAAHGALGSPEMRATERIFVFLQILSACSLAFAHGANDVANAVGPLAGVVLVAKDGTEGLAKSINDSGMWGFLVLFLGGVGIVLGLATWGWRVIETIGKKITELTPTRGFAAEFGAAATILVASRMKLPVSTTHTLVGAVLGVGFARGMSALNFRVVRDIVISWVVTLPAGALLTIVFYHLLKFVFG